MKLLTSKAVVCASVLGAIVTLSACTCPAAKHSKQHKKTDPVVFYQTYEDADVNKVTAKMYTRNSQGGESKMGYIKFYETDSGLKMLVSLDDLRLNKTYNVKIYPCQVQEDSKWSCDSTSMNIDLPTLTNSHANKLEESYIIRGLTATQLKNSKIVLERDGGYKAAWGKLY
ncbi:MAG: hypothetical protein KBS86_00120 [Proteobacteria bacterium]|nr:hypothetical protein [Candidatus Enterousia scatequi]